MSPEHIQRIYGDLAEMYDRQGQLRQRDWFLVLAADAALTAGKTNESDRLLARLLSLNPHHFLKPFGSFAEALRSPDVQGYVGNLRRNYPPAKAAELLGAEQGKNPEAAPPESPPPAAQPKSTLASAPSPPKTDESEVIFARVRTDLDTDDPNATLLPSARQPEPPPLATPPKKAPPPPKAAPPPPAPKPPPSPPVAPPKPQPQFAPLPQPEPAPPPPRPRPPQRVPPPVEASEPTLRPSKRPPAPIEDDEPPFAPAEPKPARSRPPVARVAPPPHEANPFVPGLLFVVLLLLALGVALFTFLRPFLPREWLP